MHGTIAAVVNWLFQLATRQQRLQCCRSRLPTKKSLEASPEASKKKSPNQKSKHQSGLRDNRACLISSLTVQSVLPRARCACGPVRIWPTYRHERIKRAGGVAF